MVRVRVRVRVRIRVRSSSPFLEAGLEPDFFFFPEPGEPTPRLA